MSDLGELFEAAEAEAEAGGGETDATSGEQQVVDNPVGESTVDNEVQTGADADPTDGGQGQVEAWDWSEFSDKTVSITVNGEEQLVPLAELRDGYMRQADYTQKTQEVSEARRAADWARDVQAALDRDPQATLDLIAKAYGVEFRSETGVENAGPTLDDLDEDVRPWAEQTQAANAQLAEMQRQLDVLEQQRIVAEVRSEIDGLRNQYGDSFDPESSLKLAASKNISLEDAHLILAGQRAGQVSQAAARVQADAEAQRQADKQAAATKTKSLKASDVPIDEFDGIADLFERVAEKEGYDLGY